jgi:tRNA nucleotidyltransferase (CCA-adding enzyme)
VDNELLSILNRRLTEADRSVAEALVGLAVRRGEQVYLVGGSVRDLLLGRAHVDLDIAVEGDAIALAGELAEVRQGRVIAHQAFGTASVEVASSRVDLAQARAETYSRPGALPAVRAASIDEDLHRRDFTVNAMALRLTPPSAGQLLDPHGGKGDLERRLIRGLHDASFRDDATRMLRAVRYEVRLGFRLEEETERLLRRDLSYLETISGARLRAEIVAMFFEERTSETLARCEELNILGALHRCLRFDKTAESALARAQEERPAPWDEVCLCLLCWHCDQQDVESMVRRLALPRRYERALLDVVRLRERLPELRQPDAPPSRIADLLDALTPAPVWALALRADDALAAERARRFLSEWRYVKSFLGASALRRLGVPAGPELGILLRRLRAARLDGLTHNREDELSLLAQKQEWAQRED